MYRVQNVSIVPGTNLITAARHRPFKNLPPHLHSKQVPIKKNPHINKKLTFHVHTVV